MLIWTAVIALIISSIYMILEKNAEKILKEELEEDRGTDPGENLQEGLGEKTANAEWYNTGG